MKTLILVLANIAIALAGLIKPNVEPNTDFFMEDNPETIGRVIGGSTAGSGAVPHQIMLLRSGSFTCGGSLIGTRTVLTAAHCIDGNENNPSVFTIRANSLTSSGGQIIQVSKVNKHASYSSSSINYDYAVLHLASAFTPGTNAAVGRLVASGSDPAGGTSCQISGWGRTSSSSNTVSSVLKIATLSVIARATCSTRWGRTIPAQQVCVHSTANSVCNGDSGGPLTIGGAIAGVASYVAGTACIHATIPNVYANVGPVVSWINTNSIG